MAVEEMERAVVAREAGRREEEEVEFAFVTPPVCGR